jgi:hypothetical protein
MICVRSPALGSPRAARRPRPDIVRPYQPQPVDPLRIGECLGGINGVHIRSLREDNEPTRAPGEGVPCASARLVRAIGRC